MRASFLVLVTTCALAQDFAPNPASPRVPKASHLLTNESVASLARAGFDEQFIVEVIQTSRTRFDASAAALVELKKQGVSEDLIRFIALRERKMDLASPADAIPESSSPISTMHVERCWWGYRWVTLSRPRLHRGQRRTQPG